MPMDAKARKLVVLLSAAATLSALWYFLRRKVVFLVAKQRKRAQIIDILRLSSDTKRFRLSLGSRNTVLGLPVGKHLVFYAPNPQSCLSSKKWNGKDDEDKGVPEIQRKYTPVTGNETPGYVDFVIKVYKPGTVTMPNGTQSDWADGGKLGLYLDSKKVGDYVDVMGPLGVNEYLGQGQFKLPGRPCVTVRSVGMLAGGTGVTPMLQVVAAALRDPTDSCKFSLLYANKTEEDILCRDTLDELARSSRGRFQVTYTLDFPPRGWKQQTGFITADMIKGALPAPSPDTLILMCGPPPMIEFACKRNLEALKYPKTSLVFF